jgi:Relaxase/Mobilisation nuclease domain
MVPAITAGGRSFKGAALYYLHDKRQPGEAERLTTERIAWVETINLPTGDPERAWRIMAHTALAQAELKAAAGVKSTGRKLTKPVFAYSLAWHPDEKPTKEDQLEAARASLEAQGLDQHQAVIVCHDDEPQAHIHVFANRVHPITGKAATLSNSKLKLSQWAQDYERKRGKVYCPQRVDNNARRKHGEFIRQPRTPRPVFEFNRATGNDHLGAVFAATAQRQQDAHLHEIGRTMKRCGQDTGNVREDFLKQCAELRDTQDRQREELRAAWTARNAERAAVLAPFSDRDATRRAGRAYGQGLTRRRTGDERFGGPGPDGPEPG